MNTHESYVSLETAKLLKQAGFDWECSSLYTSDGEFKHLLHNTIDWDYGEVDWNNVTCKKTSYMGIRGWEEGYSAPTLAVAQKWLRKVKEYAVIVETHNVQAACVSAYVYCIYPTDATHPCKHINGFAEDQCFDTYEEALEAGILKCLTLILEKDDSK